MKKALLLFAVAAMNAMVSGCSSLRTPAAGKNAGKVYYETFMGLSIESAFYGDGFVVRTAE
jgi:uncharacterized protein YceK